MYVKAPLRKPLDQASGPGGARPRDQRPSIVVGGIVLDVFRFLLSRLASSARPSVPSSSNLRVATSASLRWCTTANEHTPQDTPKGLVHQYVQLPEAVQRPGGEPQVEGKRLEDRLLQHSPLQIHRTRHCHHPI